PPPNNTPVEVRTDIRFVLKIGVDAEIVYSRTFTSDLINVSLPRLSYGVVTIVPRISVGTPVELQAAAKGKLLASGEMGLQDAHVLIDFVDSSKNTKGLAQQVVYRHIRYEADTSAGHQRPALSQKLHPASFPREFAILVDRSGQTMVISCSNGNMYPVRADSLDNVDCSELWAAVDDVLVYDGAQRLIHYYNNTMSTLGVSRIRVEAELEAPVGSVVVFWAPYYDPDSPDEYLFMAIDPLDQIFYPIVCDYADGTASKVFLAQDPVAGVATLQSPDVIHSITGGSVSACSALVLNQDTRQ
ncbi:putative conserved hypothetical protein, partial [Colletotrichum sublineola]